MDFTFISPAFSQAIYALLWSSLIVLFLQLWIKCRPNVQYWSALSKASLLLCLLPFVPWSLIAAPTFALPLQKELISELALPWVTNHALEQVSHDLGTASAMQTALFHLKAFTVIFVLLVSLVKLGLFVFNLVRFNQAIKNYAEIGLASSRLNFINQQQLRYCQTKKIKLRQTCHLTSPFAIGILRPCIVLPASFFTLPASQQTLLIEHELTHIKRHDLFWIMLSQLATTVLWFVPGMHFLQAKLSMAIEVECDRLVLKQHPNQQHEYASALVNIIKHTQQRVSPQAAFFNNQQFAQLKSRITFTQHPFTYYGDKAMHKIILLLTVLGLSASSWAINSQAPQMMSVADFLTLHQHASGHIEQANQAFSTNINWVNPVSSASVSAKFKAKHKLRAYRPHLGIDLKAKLGSQIVAASDGVVLIADNQSLHQNHGNAVVIDHGEGVYSMYSHLQSFDVTKGQKVKAGQWLGKVGVTGKSTGPHLHFEILTAHQHLDPAELINF